MRLLLLPQFYRYVNSGPSDKVICLKSQLEKGKVWTRTWSWGLCLRLSRDARWWLSCESHLEPSTLNVCPSSANPSTVFLSGISVEFLYCAGRYHKGIQMLCPQVDLSGEE